MSEIRKRCEQKRAVLEIERQSFMPHWRELSEYVDPRRGRFVTSDYNRGEKRNSKIINSTGTYSKRVASAGMANGITSPARPWFRLMTPEDISHQRCASRTSERVVVCLVPVSLGREPREAARRRGDRVGKRDGQRVGLVR